MRKFTLMLLSGSFTGFAWYVEPNKCGPQIGYVAQKPPPEIKPVDVAYLNGTDQTIANDEANNSPHPCKWRMVV